ncbi:LysR family transcriptional regulator [Streptosporangium sp. NBC_01755]|uniref:LysR substrate-binding domain-containing protein n=1 Tax=unclassified Streptosporangium TaxID=2632669 RepID=UPI002DD83B81|nr:MULTISPECIES: LysR substrate-binding domain-containing protein [unclassified Streptosporangium]WSA26844.1 LysR family transcriptional regulator [Streptosporangium sp. NBC_01810]WSD01731.1 LysR family transcriptional regulator [Streptosporangium sp. NBC_01755]
MILSPWRLRLLDAFERLGTVRAVAKELNLSPSTVSQQLSVLEGETKTKLFEREGRVLTLTYAGGILVARARDLLDHMESIEIELAELSSDPVGHLRIGGFASSVVPILISATKAMAESHPRLYVELREIEPHESIAALHRGTCDVIVTVDQEDGSLIDPGIRSIPLAVDPFFLLLPPQHQLRHQAKISINDLAKERWALDFPGTYLGDLVPGLCRKAQFEPIVAGRFSSHNVVLGHVAAGLSIALLPKLALTSEYDVAVQPFDQLPPRKIIAAVRRGSARSTAITTALHALSGAATDALGGHE